MVEKHYLRTTQYRHIPFDRGYCDDAIREEDMDWIQAYILHAGKKYAATFSSKNLQGETTCLKIVCGLTSKFMSRKYRGNCIQ
jgi:hypothetical protein